LGRRGRNCPCSGPALAAPLLGDGGGLAYTARLGLTARLAQPVRRGALSAVLACAYVGFAAPFVTAVVAEATFVRLPLPVCAALAGLLALRLVAVTRSGLAHR